MWNSSKFQPAFLANNGRGVILLKEDLSGYAMSAHFGSTTSMHKWETKSSTTKVQKRWNSIAEFHPAFMANHGRGVVLQKDILTGSDNSVQSASSYNCATKNERNILTSLQEKAEQMWNSFKFYPAFLANHARGVILLKDDISGATSVQNSWV